MAEDILSMFQEILGAVDEEQKEKFRAWDVTLILSMVRRWNFGIRQDDGRKICEVRQEEN